MNEIHEFSTVLELRTLVDSYMQARDAEIIKLRNIYDVQINEINNMTKNTIKLRRKNEALRKEIINTINTMIKRKKEDVAMKSFIDSTINNIKNIHHGIKKLFEYFKDKMTRTKYV